MTVSRCFRHSAVEQTMLMNPTARCTSNHRPPRPLTLSHFLPFGPAPLWADINLASACPLFKAPTFAGIVTLGCTPIQRRSAMVFGYRFLRESFKLSDGDDTHLKSAYSRMNLAELQGRLTFDADHVSRANPERVTTQLAVSSSTHTLMGQHDLLWWCSMPPWYVHPLPCSGHSPRPFS